MPEPSTDRPVPIPDDDRTLLGECRIDTFRAGGPGGQHQNTTESGVRLTHRPTGLVVHARDERSQYRNRKVALSRLRRRLESLNRTRKRRIATQPTRASNERRLSGKKRKSEKKRSRRKPRLDE